MRTPFLKLQKFENRRSVILDEELKYWEQLSLDYMTEESDDARDPNCIIEHKLPWRSVGRLTYIVHISSSTDKLDSVFMIAACRK